jgi:hypothetical protein
LDKDPPPLPSGPNVAMYDVMGTVYRAGIRISL